MCHTAKFVIPAFGDVATILVGHLVTEIFDQHD